MINLAVGEQVGSMYISFIQRPSCPINRVADYVIREVEPKLDHAAGGAAGQRGQHLGDFFAMRIWLDQRAA